VIEIPGERGTDFKNGWISLAEISFSEACLDLHPQTRQVKAIAVNDFFKTNRLGKALEYKAKYALQFARVERADSVDFIINIPSNSNGIVNIDIKPKDRQIVR
jgi:hypothetical protein